MRNLDLQSSAPILCLARAWLVVSLGALSFDQMTKELMTKYQRAYNPMHGIGNSI